MGNWITPCTLPPNHESWVNRLLQDLFPLGSLEPLNQWEEGYNSTTQQTTLQNNSTSTLPSSLATKTASFNWLPLKCINLMSSHHLPSPKTYSSPLKSRGWKLEDKPFLFGVSAYFQGQTVSLVGGWTNPSEKYLSKWESALQVSGWKLKKYVSCHRSCRTHRVGAVTRRQSIVSLVLIWVATW